MIEKRNGEFVASHFNADGERYGLGRYATLAQAIDESVDNIAERMGTADRRLRFILIAANDPEGTAGLEHDAVEKELHALSELVSHLRMDAADLASDVARLHAGADTSAGEVAA